MNDIVCPNCHSVTPPFRNCMACNCFLGDALDQTFENTKKQAVRVTRRSRTSNRWSLLNLFALIWSSIKHIFNLSDGSELSVPMDAHLRRDCRRKQKHGIRKLRTASTEEGEISVIARVTNISKFQEMVKGITTVIECASDKDTAIVTARIRADESHMEYVRTQSFVTGLKASRRIRPFVEKTREDLMSCENLPPFDTEAHSGSGVIVGIIDFGLDFVHRNFRDADGRTRILALWDQKATTDKNHCPEPYGYGRLFDADDINTALQADDPYKALGYEVSKTSLLDARGHGTYITDMAAGNKEGAGCPGIAPEAHIVFVDVATAGTPMHSPYALSSTFGDSVQVLEAIHFIFEYAKSKNLPCVINVSLGTNGGPHDGTTLLEQAIDWMVKAEPNRSVVVAAGNAFDKSLHATGHVPEGGKVDLKWHIPRFDATSNEVEIWYSGKDKFTVDIIDPDGNRMATVKPCHIWEKTGAKKEQMTVINRLRDSNNKDNVINVFFERGVRPGIWTLRLRGDSVCDGKFHAWIERDERGQSRFEKPKDRSYLVSNECTLSSIACGHETIVVGSYDAYESDRPLSEFSSMGPTRDTRDYQQPTLCAPGDRVLLAEPRSEVLRHRQSGTSISAAVVTGTVALILAEARKQNISLTSTQIREILISTAHRDGRSDIWDKGFGYGRVCLRAAVNDVHRGLKVNTLKRSATI